MSADGFRVLERRSSYPWRPRSAFAGHGRFAAGERDALVAQRVMQSLAHRARRALPDEAGGLLLGRTFADGDGDYVVVLAALQAGGGAGTRGRIDIPPDENRRLRALAAVHHPAMDVVGWWHSHPRPSGYSARDRENQRLWTDPMHVGLLVYARPDRRWGTAYLGPASEPAPWCGPVDRGGPAPAPVRAVPSAARGWSWRGLRSVARDLGAGRWVR